MTERSFSVRATEYLANHRRVLEHALGNEIISATEDAEVSQQFADELRASGSASVAASASVTGADGVTATHRRRAAVAREALDELAEVFEGD